MRFSNSMSAALVAVSCATALNQYETKASGVSSYHPYENGVHARDAFDSELEEREIIENYLFAREEFDDLVARGNGAKEVKEGLKLEKNGHVAAGKAAVRAGIKKEKTASRKDGKKSKRDLEDDLIDLIARGNGVQEVKEGLKLEKNGHVAAGKAAVRAGIKKEKSASRKDGKKSKRSIEDTLFDLIARGNGVKEVKEGLKLEKNGHKAAGKAAVRAGEKKERKAAKQGKRSIDDDLEELLDLVARGNGVKEVKEGLKLEKNGHKAAGKAAVRAGEKKERKAAKQGKRSVDDDLEELLDLVARANGVGEVQEGLKLEKQGHVAAGKAAVKDGIRREQAASRKDAKKTTAAKPRVGAKAPRGLLFDDEDLE